VAAPPVKLWHYASLARLWSWSLVAGAVLLLGIGAALRATTQEGIDLRWLGVVVGVSGGTAVLAFPALRLWLRRSALPSLRLPQAVRARGPRRLQAAPSDWRRWAVLTTMILTAGGAAMMVFLVGMLGGGGTAEGVVVGLLAAWGVATLEDARRIERTERSEGRRYYAVCRRPAAVGDRLVWIASGSAPAAESAAGPPAPVPGGDPRRSRSGRPG